MSLFLIFCITFAVFFLPAVPLLEAFNHYKDSRKSGRANLLNLWGFVHAPPYLCAPPETPVPLLRLHVIRPTPRSGMEVEEKKKTRGRKRGRRGKPVQQV